MDNRIAANVLGTAGAVCWSVQLIPQIVVNYRRHHTTGLQPTMMLLWASAGIPLGVYNIVKRFNIALQIQPQILTALSLLTWAQCKYYRDGGDDPQRWTRWRCVVVVLLIGTLMGTVEVALFFALREAVERHIEWPATLMAVLAAVLLCAGVTRHYWDIYKERTVRGISFLFVGIDALGDLTSLVSVFFQPEYDVLGMVIYGSELVLWLGVFACGGWFNFRPWAKGLRARWLGFSSDSGVNSRAHSIEVTGGTNGRETASLSSASSSTVFRTASGQDVDEGNGEFRSSGIRLRSVAAV